jgi:hypothetical protein
LPSASARLARVDRQRVPHGLRLEGPDEFERLVGEGDPRPSGGGCDMGADEVP